MLLRFQEGGAKSFPIPQNLDIPHIENNLSVADRHYGRMAKLLDCKFIVYLYNGSSYQGILKAIDEEGNIILIEAQGKKAKILEGKKDSLSIPEILISGNRMVPPKAHTENLSVASSVRTLAGTQDPPDTEDIPVYLGTICIKQRDIAKVLYRQP